MKYANIFVSIYNCTNYTILDSSSESSQRVDEFEDNTFEQNKWSNKHMKIENEGYKQTYNNFRNRISSSPIDVPSNRYSIFLMLN